jgi:DNA-binding response OmpR family regulator
MTLSIGGTVGMAIQRSGAAGLRILAADDDRLIREVLRRTLETAGHSVVVCRTGAEAVVSAREQRFDLILLDVVMPEMDGFTACARIRERSSVPIVMLTSLDRSEDVVRGLQNGADDYVVKPFQPAVLLARIDAVTRRAGQRARAGDAPIRVGELTVDRRRHKVQKGEQEVILSPTEFELLHCLASSPGAAMSRDDLLREVWGTEYTADTKLVDVCVRRLRQKIESDPSEPTIVLTVRGVGYALAEAGSGTS